MVYAVNTNPPHSLAGTSFLRLRATDMAPHLEVAVAKVIARKAAVEGPRWYLVHDEPADVSLHGGPSAPACELIPSRIRAWMFPSLFRAAPSMEALSTEPLHEKNPVALTLQWAERLLMPAGPGSSPCLQRTPWAELALHRFTLMRWPGTRLLGQYPDGRRIAPFLESRSLSMGVLSTLSGIPVSRCLDFAEAMMAAAILRVDLFAQAWPTASAVACQVAPSRSAVNRPPKAFRTKLPVLSCLRQCLCRGPHLGKY